MFTPSGRSLGWAFTPSGRSLGVAHSLEVGYYSQSVICLSMSDYHTESWNPAWTVEKILLGLMSFMYEDSIESVGSILDSWQNRKTMAADSEWFNRQNEIYCSIFVSAEESRKSVTAPEVLSRSPGGTTAGDSKSSSSGGIAGFLKRKRSSSGNNNAAMNASAGASGANMEPEDTENVCRYCLSPDGELVAPCACKGSSRWVHHACLRQWQKSVLLTQSTHPKYQTRIDAICNICETPFKGKFKPRDRAEAYREFAGDEIAARMVKGNMIVSSERDSEESFEAMEKEPSLRSQLEHWTFAAFLVLRGLL